MPHDTYNPEVAAMIVALMEEGVSLGPIARASGIPVEVLSRLPVARSTPIPTADELSAMAAQVALRTLQEMLRTLDEGDQAARIRVMTAVAGHPLRRMQTDQGEAMEEMQRMFRLIMSGGHTIDTGEFIDVDDVEPDEPDG